MFCALLIIFGLFKLKNTSFVQSCLFKPMKNSELQMLKKQHRQVCSARAWA